MSNHTLLRGTVDIIDINATLNIIKYLQFEPLNNQRKLSKIHCLFSLMISDKILAISSLWRKTKA